MAQTTFDSTVETLGDLLNQASEGKLQLPDFQRGWVWDDYAIRSLLASLTQSFPIGAVMLLQAGGEVRFRPRPIEGVEPHNIQKEPDRMILDGQQRITSLFQACCLDHSVSTMNDQKRKVKRWYYIDMKKALNTKEDHEEAIISLPEEKRITREFGRIIEVDVTSPEKEFENSLFPVNHIFDSDEWEDGYQEYWDYDKERIKFFKQFRNQIIDAFRQYQVPLISLRKENKKEAVCLVFEKVNTGGKKLDAFELLTAIYAVDDFNLRDDWLGNKIEKIEGRLPRLINYSSVLKEIASTDFLQAVSLLHTYEKRQEDIAFGISNPKEMTPVSCHRKSILNLPLSAYEKYANKVEEGFKKAARFLTLNKIFWDKDVPYQSQIIPLAAILVQIRDKWELQGVRGQLAQWLWCGVFGELYGSATESRFAQDFVDVPNWLDGGNIPKSINDANFAPDRLDSLRSRQSAAYKGINALLKLEGGLDMRSGQSIEYSSFWDESVDIHHIFPKDWCKKHDIPNSSYNSIINKTPISSKTNRIIGSKAPSRYLVDLEKEANISQDRMDEVLISHLIEPEHIRNDDYDGFYKARKESMLKLIEKAMNKKIHREQPLEGEDIDTTQEELIEEGVNL